MKTRRLAALLGARCSVLGAACSAPGALVLGLGLSTAALAKVDAGAQQKSPGAGPVVVLETVKGTIEFETYPDEAPKTVERVVELVKKNFYNGQRFHRAEPKFVVQIGDPQSRLPQMIEHWGRSGFGKPIGVSEITKKRRHLRGAVAMAHTGDPSEASSQFYITLANRPDLDGKYTVFGRVITGMAVADRLEKGDMLKRASVK